MDILDLSVGEKRSRRKAHAPQRRQALEDGSIQDQTSSHEDRIPERTICLEAAPHITPDLSADQRRFSPETDFQSRISFPEDRATLDQNNNNSNTAVLSPYSAHSNEGSNGRCLEEDGSRSPSPNMLGSSSASGSSAKSSSDIHNNPLTFLANMNANNNITLNRNLALQPTDGNPKPPGSIPDLAAFQERFGALSNTLHRSLIPDSTYDVQPIDTPGIPERTKKQNRWAFNVWREWARKRNLTCGVGPGAFGKVPMDVGKATEAELDYWLSKFVQEIRRKDGNPYPPHTLMQIVMGIQRYLRQQAGRPSICILDRSNPAYGRFRAVLDSRIKELTNEGVTSSHKAGRRSSLPTNSPNTPNHSTNYPEQSVLWNAGIIGNDTALGLLNAVFYHNTVTFGIKMIDDHWNLKMSHFVVGNRGQQSQAFIEFVPSRDPVYVNRGLSKDCRVYAEPGNPRCVVKLFQKYMSLVPPEGAFYRHPQEPTLVDRSIRFSDQWVGKNRLRAMIKHVFDSTRLDGRERHQVQGQAAPAAGHKFQAAKYSSSSSLATSQNEQVSLLAPNVYDRLAQVMMQLSHLRSSPMQHLQAMKVEAPSPAHNSTPSPRPESSEAERPTSPKENLTASRGGSPNPIQADDSDQGKPLKRKASFDEFNQSAKRLNVNDASDADDVKVTSSCEKQIDENMLEIAVPRAITAVTIVRGSRRITIQLD